MMETTETILAGLLSETHAAHVVYETAALGGAYDQEWPHWYARYLVDHDIGALLKRSVTADEVATLLTECNETYTREHPATSWPDFYARRLLGQRAVHVGERVAPPEGT
jgi:predicted  nucleic acid-binding Zn ribbon protein